MVIKRFNISDSTLRMWMRQRRLPAHRIANARLHLRVKDIPDIFKPLSGD